MSVAKVVRWQHETGCLASGMGRHVVRQDGRGVSGISEGGCLTCTACKLRVGGVVSIGGAGGGSSDLSSGSDASGGT